MSNSAGMIRKFIHIVIIFAAILTLIFNLLACNRADSTNKIKELKVYYLKGHIDALNSMDCKSVKEEDPEIKIDTLITDINKLSLVESAINHFTKIKSENNCDIRLVCDVKFTDNRNLEICLSDKSVQWNSEGCFKDNNLLYSIKYISGYYNYFSKKDLYQNFSEIKEFGIPRDHKYIEE